ncbi:MAG TPA: hypothetical protein PLC52_09430 [Anaerolineales bacterium]|nr:hypothetical protein [Anaerolineales bacterium]HRQ93071.1 hypothetical protein [Anaerolineales bacterium]
MWWIVALVVLLWADLAVIARTLNVMGLLVAVPTWLRPFEIAVIVGVLLSLAVAIMLIRKSQSLSKASEQNEKFERQLAWSTVFFSVASLISWTLVLTGVELSGSIQAVVDFSVFGVSQLAIVLGTALAFAPALSSVAGYLKSWLDKNGQKP